MELFLEWVVINMNEHFYCPECNGRVSFSDELCPHCGSALPFDSDVPPPLPEEDEFAELDYRPKAKKGLLIPLVIILTVLLFGAAGIMFLNNGEPEAVVDETRVVLPDPEQEQDPNDQNIDDGVVEESETEEEKIEPVVPEPSTPPDYNFLEPAMHNWLIERTGDGDLILLHTDELDDVEHFFERFDVEEDNIIVYMLESKDEQFVTVLFGLPFSEWSTKVAFIWRDDQWSFLREEALN
jgi:rRNA maturation protein Nop10